MPPDKLLPILATLALSSLLGACGKRELPQVSDLARPVKSLLGALSLIGLLIKNAIVLIEEIEQGKLPFTAVLDAATSRLRPVVMAAATTILGLILLLQDAFFVNMSITIMAGLGFATLLTLVIVPVLYTIFFSIPYAKDA